MCTIRRATFTALWEYGPLSALMGAGFRQPHTKFIRSLQQPLAYFGVTKITVYSPIQNSLTKEDDSEMSVFLGFIVALLVSALVIYIVGRLNLGLSVGSFGNAIVAAIVIRQITVPW